MEYQEIRNQIDETFRRYVVKYKDGKRKILKIGLHDGWIYAVRKRCRKMAHYVAPYEYAEWESMKRYMPRPKNTDELKDMLHKRVLNRAKKAIEMLSKSGMWNNIKDELEYFVSLPEAEQRELVVSVDTDSYNFYKMTFSGQKYSWVNYHFLFEQFVKDKCWKSLAWRRYERSTYTAYLQKCIEDKTNYSHRWVNGYDNSVELAMQKDGVFRGWYSEEYRGCGNGHYYLLLDATHAIHCEDD